MIFSIRTGVDRRCPVCGKAVSSGQDSGGRFDQQTNHLLEAHGWRLLHVGQETSTDSDGTLGGTPWP
jgi:hypothetical protein